jgi:hypothetical protein
MSRRVAKKLNQTQFIYLILSIFYTFIPKLLIIGLGLFYIPVDLKTCNKLHTIFNDE